MYDVRGAAYPSVCRSIFTLGEFKILQFSKSNFETKRLRRFVHRITNSVHCYLLGIKFLKRAFLSEKS